MKPNTHAFRPLHLLVGGVFGGMAAACWMLGENESLRAEGVRIPWRRIAVGAIVLESTVQVLARFPPAPFLLMSGAGVLALMWVCHREYAAEIRSHVPSSYHTAVNIGWAFAAVRVAVVISALNLSGPP